MGRGRQKAKQQKIARKLKYLTTDTDYDELAKELSAQEGDSDTDTASVGTETGITQVDAVEPVAQPAHATEPVQPPIDDDLDEYARWAAEAAAKVTGGDNTRPAYPANPVRHKPIPIPLPSSIKKDGKQAAERGLA